MTTAAPATEKNLQTQAKKPVNAPAETIEQFLQSSDIKRQFAIALPKHMKPDRFVRITLTALTKNPRLAECTKESLFSCLLDLSALGLEPDGRRAHLIPFRNSQTGKTICTMLIDYKGLVELAMNTKEVSNIHADVICEKDRFVYNMGIVERHEINFTHDRGTMYAVYCIITMKDGTKKAEVMTKAEVDGVRARSKAANAGPWVTDYNEMAKKTVFRRASKWIKLSPEVREKIEKDDEGQFDFDAPQKLDTPIVGLKHDKDNVIDAQAQPTDAEAQEGSAPENYLDTGDISRFGQDAEKVKNLFTQVISCAKKAGKEKFFEIIGGLGHESLQAISTKAQVVAVLNKLLEAVQQ